MDLLAICISSLEKGLFRSFLNWIICGFCEVVFFLLFNCVSSLYIVDINYQIYVATIFSHSIGCLCILLMVSSAEQKFFLV